MESDEESQEPIPPTELFRNRFTWFCYETSKSIMCWVLLGFSVIVELVMIKAGVDSTDDPLLRWLSFISAACCIIATPDATFAWMTHLKKRSKFSLKIAQQVLEMNPAADIGKWDLICDHLNDYFYQSNEWKTPYFFFDGKSVQDRFTEDFIKLYLDGKLDAITSANEIESVKNYLQSLREEFEFGLKEPLPEPSAEFELRRESKGKGFLGYLKNAILCLFVFLGFISPTILLVLAFWNIILGFISSSLCFYFSIFCLYLSGESIYGISVLICSDNNERQMSVRHAIKFLVVVTRVKPENILDKWDKWDQIARYMNQYLSDEQVPSSDLKFSNGRECLEFYKSNFQPGSITENLRYYELKDIIRTTQLYVA